MRSRILLAASAPVTALLFAFLCLLGSPLPSAAQVADHSPISAPASDPNPPGAPVRLVFIHHSSGQNWLNDALRAELNANNYFVTETDYGWGPADLDVGSDKIGDHTDIGHWYNWFAGPHRANYVAALYPNSNTEADNSVSDPGGENQIVMFKSCFPNSHLGGSPTDPPTTGANPLRGQDAGSQYMTVGNAKGIYNDILSYFETRQDKLFIVITAPPLAQGATDALHAANARAFNTWLVNDWLASYPYKNVAVFDFYNTLTSNGGSANTNDLNAPGGNHHRYWSLNIQHQVAKPYNFSAYPTGDSHPSAAGNRKAAKEYVPLLNIYYHRWKGDPGPPQHQIFLPMIAR